MPEPLVPPTIDLLRHAVRLIGDALAVEGWHEQPTVLLHVRNGGADQIELGMATVDAHPADALIGTVAPDGWEALGMSQLGWARHFTELGSRRRVRVTTLVSRTGEQVTSLHDELGHAEDLPGVSEGRVADVLRRCLGLPTPPPGLLPTAAFAAGLWFHAVAAAAADGGPEPMRWDRAATLHPAGLPAGAGSADAVAACRRLVGTASWEDLRWQTVEGSWAVPGVSPALASWFDAGSFARWVAPDPVVVGNLTPHLERGAQKRLLDVLVSLGLA